jgi:hypothetical protein
MKNLGGAKQQLLDLLRSELRSHPILITLDYEAHPRALREDYTVVFTKLGSRIIIDDIKRALPTGEVYQYWRSLCSAYSRAYTLPFRSNHIVLIRRSEYERSLVILMQMAERLSALVQSTRAYSAEEVMPRLHRIKNEQVLEPIRQAGFVYRRFLDSAGDTAALGRVAILLDSAVSAVHKLLIELTLPR